jgi:hypothetical protein
MLLLVIATVAMGIGVNGGPLSSHEEWAQKARKYEEDGRLYFNAINYYLAQNYFEQLSVTNSQHTYQLTVAASQYQCHKMQTKDDRQQLEDGKTKEEVCESHEGYIWRGNWEQRHAPGCGDCDCCRPVFAFDTYCPLGYPYYEILYNSDKDNDDTQIGDVCRRIYPGPKGGDRQGDVQDYSCPLWCKPTNLRDSPYCVNNAECVKMAGGVCRASTIGKACHIDHK